jgi:hypothetical protein
MISMCSCLDTLGLLYVFLLPMHVLIRFRRRALLKVTLLRLGK